MFNFDNIPIHAQKEKDFTVDTPHGELHVYDKRDEEYPGIWVDLNQPSGKNITLAMVEYISGGEAFCDYDPSHPAEMRRQREEVPESRRNGDEVSAGLVTRSWPDETDNMDNHFRTFHTGYEMLQEKDLGSPNLESQIQAAIESSAQQKSTKVYDNQQNSPEQECR